MSVKKTCLAFKHRFPYLVKYAKNATQFRNLISGALDSEINGLSEIICNVLYGNLPCSVNKLIKSANDIRFLGTKANSLKKNVKISC